MVGVPILSDQRLPDKHVPGRHRVNRVVRNQPVGHDRHPIERRALICHGGGPFAGPVRFGIRAFQQIYSDGERLAIYDAAMKYMADGVPTVILAGK